MKISNEQLRALQEAESRRARPLKAGDDFSALFTRQLDVAQTQAVSTAAPAPGLRSTALAGLEDQSALSDAQVAAKETAGQMESMFGALERYADELARDGKSDLRRAYGLLEDAGARIADFKARFANAGAEQPELAAMVNELDVLVTTETFKFNRGDYFA